MLLSTIIFLGLTVSLAQYEERIAGGKPVENADVEKFNYQVGMIVHNKNGNKTICGGVLIHPKVILTTSYCVIDATTVGIFMGTTLVSNKIDAPGNIVISSENILLHDEYNPATWENDIAIIPLPYPAQLSKYIGIIQLGSYKWTSCQGGIAWVSGWGKTTNDDNSYPFIMNYAQVYPLTSDLCRYYHYPFLVYWKQLCSVGYELINTCQGDTGGAYAFEGVNGRYLCGLNSFGDNEACISNAARGKTAVPYYHDNGWICAKSGRLVGCTGM